MPRTVIYDLKGAFGTLRKINALYDINDDDDAATLPQALWSGRTTVQTTAPIPESPYQTALNSGLAPAKPTPDQVRFFSDFSRVFYHPRSVVQLAEHDINSTIAPFERFATGEELFADLDREHDLLDRDLRPFVEEADQMQAVQVFGGIDDAWGGFASRFVERVRDEYGKVGVWVWGGQSSMAGVGRVSFSVFSFWV